MNHVTLPHHLVKLLDLTALQREIFLFLVQKSSELGQRIFELPLSQIHSGTSYKGNDVLKIERALKSLVKVFKTPERNFALLAMADVTQKAKGLKKIAKIELSQTLAESLAKLENDLSVCQKNSKNKVAGGYLKIDTSIKLRSKSKARIFDLASGWKNQGRQDFSLQFLSEFFGRKFKYSSCFLKFANDSKMFELFDETGRGMGIKFVKVPNKKNMIQMQLTLTSQHKKIENAAQISTAQTLTHFMFSIFTLAKSLKKAGKNITLKLNGRHFGVTKNSKFGFGLSWSGDSKLFTTKQAHQIWDELFFNKNKITDILNIT